jgi:hypothetical protein
MTCVKAVDPGLRRDDEFSMLFRNIEGRVQSHIPAEQGLKSKRFPKEIVIPAKAGIHCPKTCHNL